jgi:hypothetical protein
MSLRQAAQQALEALEYYEHRGIDWCYADKEAITALRTAIEQAEKQEPVAWVCYGFGGEGKHSIDFYQAEIDEIPVGTLLYTHPPQRKPLTDEEVIEHFQTQVDTGSLLSFVEGVRYAERAHGIGGEA